MAEQERRDSIELSDILNKPITAGQISESKYIVQIIDVQCNHLSVIKWWNEILNRFEKGGYPNAPNHVEKTFLQ